MKSELHPLPRSNLKQLAQMATDHVVEEGEAVNFSSILSSLHHAMRAQVVMDSLGQMKKLSKWAIFENQVP